MPGERLFDLESEVGLIVEAVGRAFDDFDLVVHPLQLAGVNRMVAVVQIAVAVPFEHAGESLQRRMAVRAGEVADVNAAQGVWSTAYPAHTAAQTAARSAGQSKDDARGGLEGAIRLLVRWLQTSPDVDDGEHAA